MKSNKSLFLDVLKIGEETIQDGLSYEELKKRLGKKKYDVGCDCIDLALKQWFFDCFHHRDQDQKALTHVEELDDHLTCNFVMKGESCLTLMDRRTAKRNLRIAMIAVIISFLGVTYSVVSGQRQQSQKQSSQVQTQNPPIPTPKKDSVNK